MKKLFSASTLVLSFLPVLLFRTQANAQDPNTQKVVGMSAAIHAICNYSANQKGEEVREVIIDLDSVNFILGSGESVNLPATQSNPIRMMRDGYLTANSENIGKVLNIDFNKDFESVCQGQYENRFDNELVRNYTVTLIRNFEILAPEKVTISKCVYESFMNRPIGELSGAKKSEVRKYLNFTGTGKKITLKTDSVEYNKCYTAGSVIQGALVSAVIVPIAIGMSVYGALTGSDEFCTQHPSWDMCW